MQNHLHPISRLSLTVHFSPSYEQDWSGFTFDVSWHSSNKLNPKNLDLVPISLTKFLFHSRTAVEGGRLGNSKFSVDVLSSYFCTGDTKWVDKLTSDLAFIRPFMHLATIILCKKRWIDQDDIRQQLLEAIMREEKVKTCLRETSVKFYHKFLCNPHYIGFSSENLVNFCLTDYCKNSLIWPKLSQRRLWFSKTHRFCENARAKRQFDSITNGFFFEGLSLHVGQKRNVLIADFESACLCCLMTKG